jgi:hypothetical protein
LRSPWHNRQPRHFEVGHPGSRERPARRPARQLEDAEVRRCEQVTGLVVAHDVDDWNVAEVVTAIRPCGRPVGGLYTTSKTCRGVIGVEASKPLNETLARFGLVESM